MPWLITYATDKAQPDAFLTEADAREYLRGIIMFAAEAVDETPNPSETTVGLFLCLDQINDPSVFAVGGYLGTLMRLTQVSDAHVDDMVQRGAVNVNWKAGDPA